MSIKDAMGNTLEVNNWVSMVPKTNMHIIAKIVGVEEGGISVTREGVTPSKVTLQISMTLIVDHRINVMNDLIKVVHPQSEETLKKALEGEKSPPGPKLIRDN